MKKRKTLYLFLAILTILPFFNLNLSAQTNESNISEYEQYDGITTSISKELIDKADKYVILKNDKYIYIDNTVLTFLEAAEVKDMINKANDMIERAKELNRYIRFQPVDKLVLISKDEISIELDGFTGAYTYWWGVRVLISKSDLNFACGNSLKALIYYLSIQIPILGDVVVSAVAGYIISAICGVVFQSGVWIDYNYILLIQGWGLQ